MAFVPTRKAVDLLGLHPNTLRRFADEQKINSIRTPGGMRLYDVESYLRSNSASTFICYCRVSSSKQKDDLNRQIKKLKELYPQAEVIQDIASGLNFKRKGLLSLLERLNQGHKLSIVVAHKDRLARFGFDLIEFLVKQNGGEIVVLDSDLGKSKESELTEDLLAILHHFSCRMHGQRSHTQSKKDKNLSQCSTEKSIPSMVWDFKENLQRYSQSSQSPQGIEGKTLDGSSEINS